MMTRTHDSIRRLGLDVQRGLAARCLVGLFLGTSAVSAATYTWANSNVAGATPAAALDWFAGGPNTQGVWIGGNPKHDAWGTTISFFQDEATPLGNTGTGGNAQAVNLNTNGVPFVLRFVTLGGKSSETPGANLTLTLTGDPLHFSNTTSPLGGTIDVRGIDNIQTLSYQVNHPIRIGTASTGVPLLVQGGGSSVLTLGGALSELRAGGGKVVKQGNSTLCLSGNNAISGGVEAQGGTLRLTGMNSSGTNVLSLTSGNTIFDLTAGNDRWSGGAAVPKIIYRGGTLTVRGAASGTSSQTLAGPETYFAQSKIVVDPNGGAGTTLTLGNAWSSGGYSGAIVIDRSAPGAVVRSSPTLNVDIVTLGGAAVIVKDANGTGFATTNSNAEVVRYTGASPLLANSSSYFVNFKTSGNLALNAGTHNVFSLELDTSSGSGILDLGTSTLNGRILLTGANDYALQNGIAKFGGWIHQFGSGTLTIGANIPEDFRKAGPGRLVLTGTNTLTVGGSVTGLTIEDGVVQAVEGVGMPTNAVLRVYGGVFQSNGSITRTVHSDSPYVAYKVSWRGFNSNSHVGAGGGFAAQGGPLTVNLDAGAVLTWGSGAFVQTSQTLVLGSTSADSLLDWQNDLNLGALPNSSPAGSKLLRSVQVDDNPASSTDIAQFSGVLSGVAGGLLKTGDGTLRLTRANTYGGPTDVTAGTLLVNGSLSAANAPVTVTSGGTLGGTGTIHRTVTAYAGGTLRPGSGGMGTLNVASNVTVHGTIAIDGAAGLSCGTDCAVGSGASLAWGAGATGRVTVNGMLTLPAAASVSFAGAPAGSLVLFDSPNAIVGSPAAWTVTPSSVVVRVSPDGKQVLASVAGGTLILVR